MLAAGVLWCSLQFRSKRDQLHPAWDSFALGSLSPSSLTLNLSAPYLLEKLPPLRRGDPCSTNARQGPSKQMTKWPTLSLKMSAQSAR